MEQLRDENSIATTELERAKSALLEAEIKAAEAHKELEEHIKCHTTELNTRVGELESKITSYTAEKDSLLAKLEEQRCREIVMREEMEKADERIAKLELELVDTKKENSQAFRLKLVKVQTFLARFEQLFRLEDELKESKVARDEVEAELTKFSRQSTELLAEKQGLEAKLAEAMANAKVLAEQGSKGNEKEIAELKRALELKTREIDRLGKLCDEFDDIEADYRQKVFSLIKERDELKAKLDPSSVKVVPVLLNALTEGVKPLTPDNSMICGEQKHLKQSHKLRAAIEATKEATDKMMSDIDAVRGQEEQLQKQLAELNQPLPTP
ncbi:hypothetical protein Q1695_001381 [Nippostrongylus brasiliensis]|nr:hypothetical protein Q1695_001381 [Nippostrongylus brasiliensis]